MSQINLFFFLFRSLRIHLEKLEKVNSKETFVDKVKDTNKGKNNNKMIRDEDKEKREAVCVSDKRQENVLLTKMELFKQFSELEIKETKANMKVCNVCNVHVHVLYQFVCNVHVLYVMCMYIYMYMYCM